MDGLSKLSINLQTVWKTVLKCKFQDGFNQTIYKFIDG
jgi:hypothetical protein